MNKKFYKIIIAIICIMFLLGFLGNLLASFNSHILHRCTEANCEQCILISNARNYLKIIFLSAIIALIYFYRKIKLKRELFSDVLNSYNPIFLKVRLNE